MVCRMKKLLLCVLLCALLALSVSAAGTQTYDLPEIGLTIEIPSDFRVLLRDELIDSGILTDDSKDITYLHAIDLTSGLMFTLCAAQTDLEDLKTMDAETFNATRDILNDMYTSAPNVSELKSGVYSNLAATYFTFQSFGAIDDINCERIAYATTHSGTYYMLVFQVLESSFTDEQLALARSVVDSLEFQDEVEAAEPEETGSSFTQRGGPFLFEDETCEFSFPVPSGWRQSSDPDDGPNEFTFYPDSLTGYLFVSVDDYWVSLSTEEQDSIDPAEIDLSWFEAAEIADWLGMETVSAVTVGDIPFYYGKTLYSYENSDEILPVIGYVTAHNGYLYYFLYAGEQDDTTADDLTGMLAGLQFTTDTAPASDPEPAAAAVPAPEQSAAAEPAVKEAAAEAPAEADVPAQLRRFALIGILAAAVLALAFVLCLVLARRSARKHPCSGSDRYLNGQEVSGDGDCVDRDDYRRRGPDLD